MNTVPITQGQISSPTNKRALAPCQVQMCDCGNIAIYRFGGDWECSRCKKLRIEFYEAEENRLRRSVERMVKQGEMISDIAAILHVSRYTVNRIAHSNFSGRRYDRA